VETYSDAEFVTLWKHAKPKERLYMLLALSTGRESRRSPLSR
jgi:hypothetical protein